MHWSGNSITRIITSINDLRVECSRHCEHLKRASIEKGFQLVNDVAPQEVNGAIAAVDSGFSTRQFVSLDVMLLRSAATVFTYEKSKLLSSAYFPNRVPGISVHYGVFPDQTDATCFRNLSRLHAELSCALQVIKMYNPSTLLLDGSLLPLPSDKPPQNSSIYPLFEEVISLYNELASMSRQCNCGLVGVVKDSRSQKLCATLAEKLGEPVAINNDEFLADILLKPSQRTVELPVSNSEVSFGRETNCFYMKAGNGLPYRVEFTGDADEIAGKLLSLSSPQFAYPSILIEVDMRAALTPGEISALFNSLEHNRALVPRSRDRPFR